MSNKEKSHLDLIKEANFDFSLPKELAASIHDLEQAVAEQSTLIDCYQDEIRSWSRLLDDADKESQVIEFFCRKRWDR
jgi:hypothetical protein